MDHLLLPRPEKLSPVCGAFAMDRGTWLPVAAQAGDDTVSRAGQLRAEMESVTHHLPSITRDFGWLSRETVIFLICHDEQEALLGIEPRQALAPDADSDQSHGMEVAPPRITLYGNALLGLLYGVQALRQLLRVHGPELPALTLRCPLAPPHGGPMLDVSRRKVPALETLRQLGGTLSHRRLNVLQLYTEHTFQLFRHPKLDAGCESLSNQDIVELGLFCRAHHIESMINLQRSGYAWNALSIPEYQHLAESRIPWTLSPAFEETYTLLDEHYADMLPSCTSTTFNRDCGESYGLGEGVTRPLADQTDMLHIYLSHVLRIRDEADKHGQQIHLWGDILLHHPELVKEVPDDVALLDWHYGAAEEYPSVTFAEAGRAFRICPGVSSCDSLFPRLYDDRENIRNLVLAGTEAGADGVLNTGLGGHHHHQPPGQCWHSYVFGAVQGCGVGTASDGKFEAAFGPLLLGPGHNRRLKSIRKPAHTRNLAGVVPPNCLRAVQAIFDEPLNGETASNLPVSGPWKKSTRWKARARPSPLLRSRTGPPT